MSVTTLQSESAVHRNVPPGLEDLIRATSERVEHALDSWLPRESETPAELHRAMRYAAISGGKYIRPLLVYAAGQALDLHPDTLDGPACAVELIHAYSLVHDDLPSMDNDDLRRGKPTCHKAFGEAVAILTGDALQSLAFHILAQDRTITVTADRRLEMIRTLTGATGSRGMAGGQAIDLAAVGRAMDIAQLELMHERKTGALIRASVRLGALSHENADPELIDTLDNYARCVGLAFQIRDDILDVEGTTATLGKTQGADIAHNKPTYPALLGMDGAKRMAGELHEQSLRHLDSLGTGADPLRWIATYIIHREN